jgi:hypothetical protein
MFSTRFLAGSSSYLITPIGHREEAPEDHVNHNRAFCDLYYNMGKVKHPITEPVTEKTQEPKTKKIIKTVERKKVVSPKLKATT